VALRVVPPIFRRLAVFLRSAMVNSLRFRSKTDMRPIGSYIHRWNPGADAALY
jgi:hypothetical protein